MIELTGITWDHPRGYAPLMANAEGAGVRVAWQRRSLKDFGDATLADLARQFDLVVLDHPHIGEAARGSILPLDSLLSASMLDELGNPSAGPSFSSYHFAGHQFALPVDAACQVASYRPDLITDDELPKTWEEFHALAVHLKTRGLYVALALCPTDSLCSFLTLAAQAGDAPRENFWIQRATVLEILARLRALRDACHPGCLDWNPIALYERMAGGEPIAYCPLAFGYTNYARPNLTSEKHRLAFTNIPGRTGALLGGAGISISAHGRDPVAAANYAAWICSAKIQCSSYVIAGGQPGHGSAWQDAKADAIVGGFFSGTRATLENAYTRPRLAGWPEFQEALGDTVHAYLKRNISATETADKLERLHATHFNS
jgi:multiple sugar transport system substrate-binding protein